MCHQDIMEITQIQQNTLNPEIHFASSQMEAGGCLSEEGQDELVCVPFLNQTSFSHSAHVRWHRLLQCDHPFSLILISAAALICYSSSRPQRSSEVNLTMQNNTIPRFFILEIKRGASHSYC